MVHRSTLGRDLLVGAALAGSYFVAGKLGLRLASLNPSATAVWAPTGIALAAFLTLGYRVWPGILLGAFLVNATTAGNLTTSLAIAVGNTLEGLFGSYLVNTFARGSKAFERVQDVFRFTLLGAMASTTISATVGVTSLLLSGFEKWSNYGAVWLTWWLGDAVGALVVAPPIIIWSRDPLIRLKRSQILEGTALLLYLFLVGQIVFGTFSHWEGENYPLEFLCVPFLVWAAVRFGPQEATAAVLVLSGVATWGTLQGSGPFVRATQNESLLLLQAFSGVMAVMTLTLAAVVAERKHAEEKVMLLATTDPLTGLANYRKLVEILEAEIERSDRTGRAFSVLLLDLDGLKKINDKHGHLVGSQALCRLANILRVHCRVIDTAARYGGDEFALCLPETRAKAAYQIAGRICERLADDHEKPILSASLGIAEYPQDGKTFQDLFRVADAALYGMKGRHDPGKPQRVSAKKKLKSSFRGSFQNES